MLKNLGLMVGIGSTSAKLSDVSYFNLDEVVLGDVELVDVSLYPSSLLNTVLSWLRLILLSILKSW